MGEVEIEEDRIVEDIPVRKTGDSKETPLIGEMGLINHRDEELWLTEGLLLEDPTKPIWIQKRSFACYQLTCVEVLVIQFAFVSA